MNESTAVSLAVHRDGATRTVRLMGRDYLVVPAVMVQEQVLQNNLGRTFLPAEEINADFAAAANGAPVVFGHPKVRGQHVSARHPEILDAAGVGFVFHSRVEDSRLKGDIYLDLARKDQIADLKVVLEALETDQKVELSTSFNVRLDKTPGAHNGQKYDVVLRPVGTFDHLAIFASGEKGACSVADGCGLGANEEAENFDPSQPRDKNGQWTTGGVGSGRLAEVGEDAGRGEFGFGQVELQPGDQLTLSDREGKTSVEVSDYSKFDDIEHLTVRHTDGDLRGIKTSLYRREGSGWKWAGEPVRVVIADPGSALAERYQSSQEIVAMGNPSVLKRFWSGLVEIFAGEESDEDKNQLLYSALREKFGGERVMVWPVATYSEEGYLVYQREAPGELGLFKVTFEIDSDGAVSFGEPEEVRKKTTFEPARTTGNHSQEGEMIPREQLIDQLAQKGPLDRAALEKLSDCQLKALNGAPAAAPEAPPAANGASDETRQILDAVAALGTRVAAIDTKVVAMSSEIQQVKESTAPAVAEQEREREEIVNELAASERCAYTADELKGKSTSELRKIQQMTRGTLYAGKGGPKVAVHASSAPEYADPVPYFADNAAKMKEA